MDNKITIDIIFNEDREINSWVFSGDSELNVFKDSLIQAHMDITDILLSPPSCLYLFPIHKKPEVGKVYKDLYLIHPTEIHPDALKIFCVNDAFLKVWYPGEETSFFLNRIEYTSLIGDSQLMLRHFRDHNLHFVGVYHEPLLGKFKVLENGNDKE